jgi:hypothetical protein
MTSVNPSLEELVITEEPKKSENVEKKEEMAIGLGELQVTDKIVIQQMSGLMNNCCCYEGENMFEISDRLGHVILRAKEDSSCCYRSIFIATFFFLCCHLNQSLKLNFSLHGP